MSTRNNFHVFIGLELHAQLLTNTKMFCGCKNSFGQEPNLLTCPVCLGLPGALPVVNKKAVELALKFAMATSCKVNKHSWFDRKNYFYPDLAKGYQITQFFKPLAQSGKIKLESEKTIRINDIHLEEDSARSIHYEDYVKNDLSYLDFNRSGVPLLEIVTEPELQNAEEVIEFLKKIIRIMQYLKICDGKLQDGSLRCDLNISVSENSEVSPDWKVEIKNLNSMKAIKKTVKYEVAREIKSIEKSKKLKQQTRKWNETKQITELLRSKEKDYDYRYFPDPDLPPLDIEKSCLEEVEGELPELPSQKKNRFEQKYHLDSGTIELLIRKRKLRIFLKSV